MEKTSLVLAFLIAAVLTGILLRMNILKSAPAPVVMKENFMQQPIGMPLNQGGMGPYDQVGGSGWAASEPAPMSGLLPGQASEGNQLMLLVGNKVDPECCPAAFNTDTGCVCLTQHDKDLFASRGGNRA